MQITALQRQVESQRQPLLHGPLVFLVPPFDPTEVFRPGEDSPAARCVICRTPSCFTQHSFNVELRWCVESAVIK